MAGFAFISYAREDREYVEKLVRFLGNEGIDAWYDEHINPGKVAANTLLQKIRECAAFIVVMSPASADSGWVVDELDAAKSSRRSSCRFSLRANAFSGLGNIQCEYLTGGTCPPRGSSRCCGCCAVRASCGSSSRPVTARCGRSPIPLTIRHSWRAAAPSRASASGTRPTASASGQASTARGQVAFIRSGEQLATAGPENTVCSRDTASGELIKQIGTAQRPIDLDPRSRPTARRSSLARVDGTDQSASGI